MKAIIYCNYKVSCVFLIKDSFFLFICAMAKSDLCGPFSLSLVFVKALATIHPYSVLLLFYLHIIGIFNDSLKFPLKQTHVHPFSQWALVSVSSLKC